MNTLVNFESALPQLAGQFSVGVNTLRKMLVDTALVAVVSLPAGVFNPYSGVKTSILFLDRRVHKQTDKVLFVKVQNDGFNLGAQRRAVVNSDLPEATRLLRGWMKAPEKLDGEGVMSQAVERGRIGESGDFNLSGERYISIATAGSSYPLLKLDELCLIERGGSPRPIQEYMTDDPNGINWIKIGDAPVNSKYITSTKEKIRPEGASRSRAVKPGDFILSNSMSFGRPYIMATDGCIHDGWLLLRTRSDNLLKDYLYLALGADKVYEQFVRSATGGVVNNLNIGLVKEVLIPLPPLEVQHQIVAEVEGYQKVIDGARQVLDNYKPHIVVNPDWPVLELGDLCKPEYGYTAAASDAGSHRFVRITDIDADGKLKSTDAKYIDASPDAVRSLLAKGDILVARTGATFGKTMLFNEDYPAIYASYLIRLSLPNEKVIPGYYWAFAQSTNYWNQANALMTGGGQPQFNGNALVKISVPVPDLATQRAIVAEIEAEQALVNTNRELIRRMEAKVKAAIDRVWGLGR